MYFKIGALTNLAILTKKAPVLESFINKVSGVKVGNFIKTRL